MTKFYDLELHDHFMNKNFEHGRTSHIREIVLHHNAGHGIDPYQTWQTREASAHFQVWGSGRIDYLVHVSDTAWHAHEANAYSIGIEHENSQTGGDWPIADHGLQSSAKLVGYLCARWGLGLPSLGHSVTTHHAVESDGVGVDTGTACPGPYFLKVLNNPNHWYWAEAHQAYHRIRNLSDHPDPAPKPGEKLYQGAPVPSLIARGSGQYLGLITGPKNSHGGFNVSEQHIIKMLQERLVVCGFVPGHTNPYDGWADGRFEEPTKEAVTRFQRSHMPHTTFYGQVWYDDWQKLFNL